MSMKLASYRDQLLVSIKEAREDTLAYATPHSSQLTQYPPPMYCSTARRTGFNMAPDDLSRVQIPLVCSMEAAHQRGPTFRNYRHSPYTWFLSSNDYSTPHSHAARGYGESDPMLESPHPPPSSCLQSDGVSQDVMVDYSDVLVLPPREDSSHFLSPVTQYPEAADEPRALTEDERIVEMILDLEEDYGLKYQKPRSDTFQQIKRSFSDSLNDLF